MDNWIHQVAIIDVNGHSIFLDNVNVTAGTSSAIITNARTLDRTKSWVGKSLWESTNTDDWFESSMDNLRIYNRVLDNTEI